METQRVLVVERRDSGRPRGAEAPDGVESTPGDIVTLTLNRPAQRNALDVPLLTELAAALAALATDGDARVVVLTGAGGSFCAGADLVRALPSAMTPEAVGERIEQFHAVIRSLVALPQPVIAAVDGPAVGFGADLALACDLRVLSERAYLQEKFVSLGLMCDGGGSYWLPRLVGTGRALELLLLGEPLDAAQARKLGLAHEVAPNDALEQRATALATRLAAGPPLALARLKRAVRASFDGGLEAALAREKASQTELLLSRDVAEGFAAWQGKRPPVFRGR